MGLVFGFALVGLVVYGSYVFAFVPDKRAKTLMEIRERPFYHFGVFILVGFFFAFFFGVLIPPLGSVRVYFGSRWLPLWQVGGIGCVVGMIGGGVCDSISRRR